VDDPGYRYVARWSGEGDAWVGLCDGFTLVSHLAPTEGEALGGIRALVATIVADMRAAGEALPRPVPWETHGDTRIDAATARSS
jgi:hypothetical protein